MTDIDPLQNSTEPEKRDFPHELESPFRAPFAVPERLRTQVEALGLEDNVREIKEKGFTILKNVAPGEYVDKLRNALVSVVESDEKKGLTGLGPVTQAPMLLGRDPLFVDACLFPKIQVFSEIVMGAKFQLSLVNATLKDRSEGALELHSDNFWVPDPFPAHPMQMTYCWATEELTKEAGCTIAVPGTHKLFRQPTADEIVDPSLLSKAVSLECSPGDVPVWLGETWHGNNLRTIDGRRAMLHMTMTRYGYRPMESYHYLDEEWIARQPQPDVVRQLLGRYGFLCIDRLSMGEKEFIELMGETAREVSA